MAELASHQGWLENIDAVSRASYGVSAWGCFLEWGCTWGTDTGPELAEQYRTWM